MRQRFIGITAAAIAGARLDVQAAFITSPGSRIGAERALNHALIGSVKGFTHKMALLDEIHRAGVITILVRHGIEIVEVPGTGDEMISPLSVRTRIRAAMRQVLRPEDDIGKIGCYMFRILRGDEVKNDRTIHPSIRMRLMAACQRNYLAYQ